MKATIKDIIKTIQDSTFRKHHILGRKIAKAINMKMCRNCDRIFPEFTLSIDETHCTECEESMSELVN